MTKPILVPPLGQTTDTVVLSAWYKRVGETVVIGEPLFAIETDKATLDIEAQDAGILQSIVAGAGDEVAVLSVIGAIAGAGESEQPAESSPLPQTSEAIIKPSGLPVAVAAPNIAHLQARETRFFISPRARKLAEENKVDWHSIKGTGPSGSVVARDVRALIDNRSQPSVTPDQSSKGKSTASSAGIPAESVASSEVDVTLLLQLLGRYTSRGKTIEMDDIILTILSRVIEESPIRPAHNGNAVIAHVQLRREKTHARILTVPMLASINLVRRISDEAVPISAADITNDNSIWIAFVNLGEPSIDRLMGVYAVDNYPVLQLGRVQHHADGTAHAWLSLHFSQMNMQVNHAAALLGDIARMMEDPDLLL